MRIASSLLALALGVLALGSCGDPKPPAEESEAAPITDPDAVHARVAVLVDLSETWHNEASRARNGRLLTLVNEAVATAAEDVNGNPLAFSYYPISANNYFTDPICSGSYTVSLIPGEEGFFRREDLLGYMNDICVRAALQLRPQQVTPIAAAIISAAGSMQDPPGEPRSRKQLIILSDMKEEGGAQPPHAERDLEGFDIIILFRALPEDQSDPTLLQARLQAWQRALETRGAHVYARPDTGVTSPDLVRTLRARSSQAAH